MKPFFTLIALAFFIVLCSSSNVVQVPLSTNGLAYFTDVSVGTPKLDLTLEVRTSYGLTLIPGNECSVCSGKKYFYNASSTSSMTNCTKYCNSCRLNACGFNLTSNSSLIEGIIVQDILSIGSLQVKSGFGNIMYENGSFLTNNGILGLGSSPLIKDVPTTLDALNISKVFEIGLTKQSGFLVLGGYNYSKQANNSNYYWTDMTSDGPYAISVDSIKVQSTEVSIVGSTYIDCGAQFIYLIKTLTTPIQQAVTGSFCKQARTNTSAYDFLCGNNSVFQDETRCAVFSDLENNLESIFPVLLFDIEDAGVFNLSAKHYFYNKTDGNVDYVCYGIRTWPLIALGSLFIRAFQSVVFDVENKRIGFQADDSTYNGPGSNHPRTWIYIGIAFGVIMVVIVVISISIVFMKKLRHRHHIDHI